MSYKSGVGGAPLFCVTGVRTIAGWRRSDAKWSRTIALGVAALQRDLAPLHCHFAVM